MMEGRKIITLTKNPLNIQLQIHQTHPLSISNQGMMMVQSQASLYQSSTQKILLEGHSCYPRAKVTRKVVEDIEKADGERVQKLSYILGIGNGKVEELISYNQLVDHLEAAANEDNEINDDLFKFRALIGHQGPLKPTDPNWKGCKFNVLVEWETGDKTYEPLPILAADDPVTCATYAKENDLLHIEGWKRFRNLAKRDKTLASMQSKIRQVRRSSKYMFGHLIPKS